MNSGRIGRQRGARGMGGVSEAAGYETTRPAPAETFGERVERLAAFLNCVEHQRAFVAEVRDPEKARQRVDAWYREVFGVGSAGAYMGTETVLAMCVLLDRLAKGERDAARLAWLEEQCFNVVRDGDDFAHHIGDVMLGGGFGPVYSCEVGERDVTGIYGESRDSLRAAIDAAMQSAAPTAPRPEAP